jgi:hypothetical protein
LLGAFNVDSVDSIRRSQGDRSSDERDASTGAGRSSSNGEALAP